MFTLDKAMRNGLYPGLFLQVLRLRAIKPMRTNLSSL